MSIRPLTLALILAPMTVACMSAGPSAKARQRISGADSPGVASRAVPKDAVVRLTFPSPSARPAFDGNGDATTLPPARDMVARVTQRTGDSLWVAVSQLTLPEGSRDDYPARGPRARLVPVRLGGSDVTLEVLNANPRRAEKVLTTGVVTFFALIGTIAVYCSQEPCMR